MTREAEAAENRATEVYLDPEDAGAASGKPVASRTHRAGQRVGPFQLVERLSLQDDIGLYRANRPAGSREPREVAIRLAEDTRDDRAAAWVRHEYDILRRLDDPRIPRAYGYYGSQVGVATSLPPPYTLADVLEHRRGGRIALEYATALDILVEIAEALRHAHAIQGPDGPIQHGHLQPSQIGLTETCDVVVLGFGAAPTALAWSYIPPEQVAGAFVDIRSDQWRLGALAIELVTNATLYEGAENPQQEALEGRVTPWVARLERRQPELARVVQKMLAPAAGGRYSTDGELIRDLLEVARLSGGRPDRAGLGSRLRAFREAQERQEAKRREDARAKEEALAAAQAAPPPAPKPKPTPPRPASTARPATTRSEPAPVVTPIAVAAEVEDDLDDAPSVDLPTTRVVPQVEAAEGEDSIHTDPSFAPIAPARPPVDPSDADSLDDLSFGLGRVQLDGSGPSLGLGNINLPRSTIAAAPDSGEPSWGLEIHDPLSVPPTASPAVDPAAEVTEMVSPVAETPNDMPPTPAALRPANWFPSELAAMAAIGVVAIVAVVFLVWRFG